MNVQVIDLNECRSLYKEGAKHTYILDAEDTANTSLLEHINIKKYSESAPQSHIIPITIHVLSGRMKLCYGRNQVEITTNGSILIPSHIAYKMINEEVEILEAVIFHNLLGKKDAIH